VEKFKPYWLTRIGVLALALAVFAACDDTTSPNLADIDIDPEETAAIVGAVAGSLDDNETLQSYNSLAEFMASAFGGAAPAPFAIDTDMSLTRALGKTATKLAACGLNEPTAALAGPLIGGELPGTVFVWNTDLMTYVPGGGPPPPAGDAVRFMIYAIDPISGLPVVQSVVGYVDFIDESDASGNKLRTIVTPVEASPVVNYQVTCALAGGISVTGSGFITDGTTQVNIDLALGVSQLGTVSIDFSLDVPSQGVEVSFIANASDFDAFDDEFGSFTATFVISRNNSIRFNLAVVGGDLDGSVLFCDSTGGCATAALIGGSFDQPIVTDASGDLLSQDAIFALLLLFESAGQFVEHLLPMLGPAFEICFPFD
jgi:hypothetical protein